jgi:Ca-activated chloride channel family protein
VKSALAQPELAPLLIAATLIVALCGLSLLRRRRALAAFAGPGASLASASPARQIAKLILVGGACLLAVVALVGPQLGEVPRRGARSAVDTVIALDVSQSMAVKDGQPDRLRTAQRAIEIIGQQLAGGRVGLTLFAGSSVVRYPLTADTRIVGPALDTSGHGFRMNPGSSLRAALQGAAVLFPTSDAANARAKAIVIVSDGEDPAPDLPPLDTLRARNIHVFTLGVGTLEGGPVPVYDAKGQFQQMLVDANGAQVTSRLDEARLTQLAAEGGGRYFRYDSEVAAKSLTDGLRAIDTAATPTDAGVSPEDRYQIFLAIAVVLLLADWLIDERRRMPRPRVPRGRAAPRRRLVGAVTALLLLVVSCGPADPIADEVDAANQVFLRDPAGAVTRYRTLQARRPASPEISIDLGNALAALGENDKALVEYGRGIDNAKKGTTRAIAFYDRATSLFRLGRIPEARAAYVETLRLDPNDRDAKFNIEVIDKILGLLRPQVPGPTSQPGQRTPPPGSTQQPGGSPAATAPDGSGVPTATLPPGTVGPTGAAQPQSVQTALTDFRRGLTVEEALRLLDALRGEQRGLSALLEGTGVRRGGNVDVPY